MKVIVLKSRLTISENLSLKAITAARDLTGDATSSLRYVFKASLNTATNAVASPLAVAFKITSTFANSR